jgi:hypothetical protein
MSSLTVPIPPDLSPACRAGNTDLGTAPIDAMRPDRAWSDDERDSEDDQANDGDSGGISAAD